MCYMHLDLLELSDCYAYSFEGQTDARNIDVPTNKIFRRNDLKYDSNRDFIGRGGFAEVYKAVLLGNRTVAFKKPNIGGSRFTDRYAVQTL